MSSRRDEVVRVLIGRDATEEERQTAATYGDLRWALRVAREDAGLSQTEIAARMAIAQSEVSRLETSVGPVTRLGRLRDYLAACGARMQVVVTTRAGRELRSPAAAAGAMVGARRAVDAMNRTLDAAVLARELTPAQALRLHQTFVRHLMAAPAALGGGGNAHETEVTPAAPAGMSG